MRTDLHIHTTASDGRWTPEVVIAGVQAAGIALFAVADHDTTGRVRATAALARAAGIAFLRGVEVSTMDRRHGDAGLILHFLGYGIDLDDRPLQTLLATNEARLCAIDDARRGSF